MKDQADELRKMMRKKNMRKQRVIAVASGKGGVGKTNLSINLAIALSRLNQNVLVLDADLGLANVNIILGSTPEFNLLHVVRGVKTLPQIIMNTPFGIKYIAGASGFSELANMSEQGLTRLITGLEYLNNTDIIIVDTSAGISDSVLYFILAADESLIITTPEPTAMLDAYGMIKTITSEKKNADIKLIVNRVSKKSDVNKVGNRIVSISKEYLDIDVDYIGHVFDDNTVPYSVLRQVPFYAYDNKCGASVCLDNIARKIIDPKNEKEKKPEGLGGFFGNLMNMSKKI